MCTYFTGLPTSHACCGSAVFRWRQRRGQNRRGSFSDASTSTATTTAIRFQNISCSFTWNLAHQFLITSHAGISYSRKTQVKRRYDILFYIFFVLAIVRKKGWISNKIRKGRRHSSLTCPQVMLKKNAWFKSFFICMGTM